MAKRRKTQKWTTKTDKKEYLEKLSQDSKEEPREYSTKEDFLLGEYIVHPKFGLGFIFNILSTTKIEVYFDQNEKILLQNWKK